MADKITVNKAIQRIMKEKGVTQIAMANAIGKKRATEVSARLVSNNMTFDKAIEMLSVLGYEVTIQPRRAGNRPSGQYVIAHSKSIAEDGGNET